MATNPSFAVEVRYPNGVTTETFFIEPNMVLCGGHWLAGVTHPAALFNGLGGGHQLDMETICYAINEGREIKGKWQGDADDDPVIRWRVLPAGVALLREHGIIE